MGRARARLLSGRDPSRLRWPADAVPERIERVLDVVRALAAARDATMSQIAIAWLLRRSSPPLVPIVGVRSDAQLADNLGAADVVLTDEERRRLDEAGKPRLGFPRSFLESPDVRELIYGDTWGRLRVASS